MYAWTGLVIDAPDPVSALNQGIWAVTSDTDGHLILVDDRSQASLFYQYTNNTSAGGQGPSVATGTSGIVVTPGGTATIPSSNTVDLSAGTATAGVSIGDDAGDIPTLLFHGGSFTACLASTLNADDASDPDEIVLNFVADGQRVLQGCATVQLISVCSGAGAGQDDVGALGTALNVLCQPN
ncbi:hypothetical protein K504DRAFT_486303 [Pleomassaria siparia CBS 279.74]|uniref:DUF7907 domain-containing protein n=1 Tax=Pleomassaria siparia CBS 279.74 TaxID=1314801 RepID=A0A6G1KPQ6_9PLEO|nr:hypothetical protein K504DRAFT_486303 [Pleomassaria siparia CBS 279.74]